MLAPQPPEQMKKIKQLVPTALLSNSDLDLSVQTLTEEIDEDYEYSLRKSIGNFWELFSSLFLWCHRPEQEKEL